MSIVSCKDLSINQPPREEAQRKDVDSKKVKEILFCSFLFYSKLFLTILTLNYVKFMIYVAIL